MNAIKCLKCDNVAISRHRHDMAYCGCGECATDGGSDYKRRFGESWIELDSEYTGIDSVNMLKVKVVVGLRDMVKLINERIVR